MSAARYGTTVELLGAPSDLSPALPGEDAIGAVQDHGVGHDEVEAVPGAGAAGRAAIGQGSGR